MEDEKDIKNEETTDAKEDDAREEDIVEDTDADTRDIEEQNDTETDMVMKSIKSVLSMVEDLAAKVDKISNAQDVITTNARIVDNDTSPVSHEVTDDVPRLSDFDLTL